MSDSEDSTVTYTEVSSPFEDLSDIGSLGVVVHGYDGLPIMPEDPYAFVEAAMQEPPPPDYVPEPVYPEFMPPEDDVLPAEEQPLPTAVSPTTDSPDDDDEEEESSRDDADNEEEDEGEDEKEEEEHPASADSVPPPAHHTTARISIRAQTPVPFLSEEKVDRLLALPSPPPSPLTSYSSPLPQIPSPPLPASPPLPISPSLLPASPTYSLGYRTAMIWLRARSPSTSHPLPLPPPIIFPHTRASIAMMRAAVPSTYVLAPRSETPPLGTPPLLPIPLPTSSPPLLLPSIDRRTDRLSCRLGRGCALLPVSDISKRKKTMPKRKKPSTRLERVNLSGIEDVEEIKGLYGWIWNQGTRLKNEDTPQTLKDGYKYGAPQDIKSSDELVSPFLNLERVVRNRQRNRGDPSLLIDFEEVNMANNHQGPPPVGPIPPPIPQNHGPPPVVRPNGPAPDRRSMEELCQPSINGRGRPIASIPIQATDFGLRHYMIQ
ncbi:hypothetical protein Tco_1035764 [Tanacetum coccineum]